MVKRGGLGKGLDALIPGAEARQGDGGLSYISVSLIDPNPRQPRHQLDTAMLEELAASIREHGILQPLIVMQDSAQPERYILIAGERRLRAARIAGMDLVPVLVRQATDQQLLELALIENVQRADLLPLETAEAYRQLHEEFNLSHDTIATRVGKSRPAVTNTIRLLNLPESVRAALAEGAISEGHARALLSLNSPQAQAAALKTVLSEGLNVRRTETLVRKLLGDRPVKTAQKAEVPEITDMEERLRDHLGTRVALKHGKKGGSITLYYFSDEELEDLVSRILKEQ
jgi:ParB family transcriptional regulator, chromosome partitioning protein